MANLLIRTVVKINKIEKCAINLKRTFRLLSANNLNILKTNNSIQTLTNTVELVPKVSRISLIENRLLHSDKRTDIYANDQYELSDTDQNRSYRDQNRPYRDENRSFRDNNRSFRDHNRSFRDHNRYENGYEERDFRKRDWGLGANLEERDWEKVKLVRLQKNVYNPLDKVNERSHEEIQAFRDKNKISIVNKNDDAIPNPILEFEEGGFPEDIIDKLKNLGFDCPMPIQAQAWPIVMSGRDLIGIGETGSGKTLGFMLPALLHIANHPERQNQKRHSNGPIALVLAPTRELAQQINAVARQFGQGNYRIRSTCLFGGSSKGHQIRELERGVDLVIATPGRLIDLLESNITSLERCSYIVLDEADRMLDMGFEPQIRKILGQIRPDRQMLMWSATWPEDVKDLADDFLIPSHSEETEQYVQLNIGSTELQAAQTIQQNIEIISGGDIMGQKQRRLLELLADTQLGEGANSSHDQKILIFAQTKRDVDFLERIIRREGHNASSIHGGKTQMQRDSVLERFRTGRTPILVATDVAARGIDVSDIQCVINFEFPKNIEDYVHRIGRTGRAGKLGKSYAFFTEEDSKLAKSLVKVLKEAQQLVPEELQDMASPLRSNKRQQNQSYDRRPGHFKGHEQRYNRDFLPQNRRKRFNLLYEE